MEDQQLTFCSCKKHGFFWIDFNRKFKIKCGDCRRERQERTLQRKKLYCKKWRKVNKESLREKKKQYYLQTYQPKGRRVTSSEHKKRKKAECDARYRKKYKEKIRENKRNYRIKNRVRLNKKMLEQFHSNINLRLRCVLRNRIRRVIRVKGINKIGSAVRDLGCTIQEFKKYIESKFLPGMTWDNYGTFGWHIDHIIPLAAFNLSIRDDFLRACHYTNLQPLWAIDNLRKGKRRE